MPPPPGHSAPASTASSTVVKVGAPHADSAATARRGMVAAAVRRHAWFVTAFSWWGCSWACRSSPPHRVRLLLPAALLDRTPDEGLGPQAVVVAAAAVAAGHWFYRPPVFGPDVGPHVRPPQ